MGVVLLEEVSLGMGFEVSRVQARPSGSLFLLPVGLDVEFSTISPAPCLPECHHIPHNDEMD